LLRTAGRSIFDVDIFSASGIPFGRRNMDILSLFCRYVNRLKF